MGIRFLFSRPSIPTASLPQMLITRLLPTPRPYLYGKRLHRECACVSSMTLYWLSLYLQRNASEKCRREYLELYISTIIPLPTKNVTHFGPMPHMSGEYYLLCLELSYSLYCFMSVWIQILLALRSCPLPPPLQHVFTALSSPTTRTTLFLLTQPYYSSYVPLYMDRNKAVSHGHSHGDSAIHTPHYSIPTFSALPLPHSTAITSRTSCSQPRKQAVPSSYRNREERESAGCCPAADE